MKIKLIIGATAAILLSSCSTITHTAQTAGVDTEVYNLTVADMDVSKEKVSKTAEWKWNPLSTVSLKEQKKTAEAELLKEADADVLVEPQYEVKRAGLFRGGSVTVSGYPAKYKNFRPMTKADAEIVATLDGKMVATYPFIATSATPGEKTKPRSPKAVTAYNGRRFAALIGGAVTDPEDNAFVGAQLGLMYGSYGKSWGWYAKAVWQNIDESWDEVNGFAITVGAIKPLTRNFNILFGTGVSTGYAVDYGGWQGNYFDKNFALPVDFGFQWSNKKITALAGLTAQYLFNPSHINLSPFIGIGYNF